MDKNFAPKFFTFLSPFRSNFVGSFNGFRDVRPCQIRVLMDFVTVRLYPFPPPRRPDRGSNHFRGQKHGRLRGWPWSSRSPIQVVRIALRSNRPQFSLVKDSAAQTAHFRPLQSFYQHRTVVLTVAQSKSTSLSYHPLAYGC
jgi:hypothetical protein